MKKFLGIFVRLVISVALLWYVFSSIDDKEKILTVLLNANWQYLLAGFLFFFVHYATVFWRWHFVLKTIGHIKIAAKSILLSLLGGNILGLITPGRVGELARGLFVREKDFWEITGLTLLEKAYANSISIVFGVAAFLILGYDAPFASSVFVGVLLILLALALILIFLPAKFAVILLFLQQILPGRLQKIIAPLVNPLQQLNTWRSLKLAFLSALVNISAFIEFMLFLNAFSDVALFPAFWAFEAGLLYHHTSATYIFRNWYKGNNPYPFFWFAGSGCNPGFEYIPADVSREWGNAGFNWCFGCAKGQTIAETSMSAVFLSFAIFYALNALYYFVGLLRLNRQKQPTITGSDLPFVSVIIPARNEGAAYGQPANRPVAANLP
jgi:uncharacterized membrane protein YbhN (UPF0104 family)